jgi:HlyD family secretion protein
MTRKKKWIISGVVVVIVVVGLGLLMHKPAVPPQTVKIELGQIQQTVIITGQIVPQHAVQVKSQISGTVSKVLVEEGQLVKKGQQLVMIDPNPTPSDYAAQVSSVASAQAQYDQLKRLYQRNQTLLQQHAIAEEVFDESKSNYLVSQTNLELAKQQLALMIQGEAHIGGEVIQNRITSPIDGYVLQRNVDVGDSIVPVTPYQAGTPLFTLANMSDLYFKGDVNQVDVGQLHPGMSASIEVAALPDLTLTGKIERVALLSDQTASATAIASGSSTSLFPSQSDVQNGFEILISGFTVPADQLLRAGYQANATVITQQLNNVLLVPQQALHFESGKPYVMLLNTPGKPAVRQDITLGANDVQNAQVLSGLKAGDVVIVGGESDTSKN